MWQPDGEQFTKVFRLKSMCLSWNYFSSFLSWRGLEVTVVAGYLACLPKVEYDLQQWLIGQAWHLAMLANGKF